MKYRFLLVTTLFTIFLFSFKSVSAEGSKELNNNGVYSTYLYLCNNFTNHCSSTGGIRSHFAVYNDAISCADNDRLYFHIKNTNEILYMGYNGGGVNLPRKIVFRIKEKVTGNTVYTEADLPTAGTGYITDLAMANAGPLQLGNAGGYDALVFTPPYPGTFYVEFTVRNTDNTVNSQQFNIDLFDLTVATVSPAAAVSGRVWSKAWQLAESTNFHGKNYIISDDSIITSATFTNMDGGAWVLYCNQTGCGTTNWIIDRKSLDNQQALFPQYKVFLNIPDPTVFPAASTLGQIVQPAPWGERNCLTGHIVFHVNVDKPGNAEVTLSFQAPYTAVSMNQPVVSGENLFDWDGLDGGGMAVPNNILITFTVTYLNGLTNLPLYDVEGNLNGFTIGLVNPPGLTPLVYWDDTNIIGPPAGTSNFAGCLSPPGCHTWSGQWGDHNTINTWWYNVSTSTSPATIVEFRGPQPLVYNQVPPQTYCAGTGGVIFNVVPDPNSDTYVWTYTGTGATINQATPSSPNITIDFATNATSGILQVYGVNTNCAAIGPTSSLFITINPQPAVSAPFTKSICSGGLVGMTLTSPAPGAIFSWANPAPTCTPNIITCPPGINNSTLINDILTLNNSTAGTVTYHVTPTANGCPGPVQDVVVTVNPLPIPPVAGNSQVCAGSTGNVYTTTAGMSGYQWSIPSGGIITSGANTSSATVTWTTPGMQSIQLNYTDVDGCTATTPTSYGVTVNPLPVPAVIGASASCIGLTQTYTTTAGMSNYIWNLSAGGSITSGGSTSDNSITILWNTTGPQWVSLNYTDLNSCTALTPSVYAVTVNPLPVPTLTGNTSICAGTTGVLYVTENGQNSYIWTVSAGGIITAGGGSGDNTVTITWNTPGPQTVSVNYSDLNTCTAVNPTVLNLTVHALPVPTLNGNSSVCHNSTGNIYTTESGRTNYTWTISPGGTITAGGNGTSNTATVTWNTVGANWIAVSYTDANNCQPAAPVNFPVTVNPRPVPTITGTTALCAGSTGMVYSTEAGMTNYTWSVSAGGTVTSGGTSSDPSVTVTWNTAGAQSVAVNYSDINSCSAATPTNLPVTVNPLPVPVITGPAAICLNAQGTYNTEAGMINYTWNVPTGGIIISGATTNSAVILWNSLGTHSVVVNYFDANGCTAATPTVFTVQVNFLPVPALSGNNLVCQTDVVTYTSDAGMTNYTWSVSPGGTITAGGGTSDATVTVNWTTAGAQTVSVNYIIGGSGCTAATPTVYNVTVKPKPAVSNAVLTFQQCSALQTNIVLQSTVAGSTYSWTANPSSGFLTGASAGSGPDISQTLVNSGFNTETATYAVTPVASGCTGDPTSFIVTVFPVANVILNPVTQSFCSGGTTAINISGNVTGSTFSWISTGSSGNVSGFSPGGGPFIAQTLSNTGTMVETVTYTITPVANNCTGTSNTATVTVNPLPMILYAGCMDQVTTTDSKPFRLKGGTPPGGSYSGPGVSTGIFNPAAAGPGIHTIVYSYLNNWGCGGSQTSQINVLSPAVFTCGNILTDIRDNATYPTLQLGTQCWMAANLNYGNSIPAVSMQRDNCIAEKFCYGDAAGNCTSSGGLYQWDELMQYESTVESQGFCPSGWHIPSENEWNTLFNFYTSSGFAGDPLKFSGYSGFNAFLTGSRFDNRLFDYSGFAVFFWSSDLHGPYKAWAHALNIYNPSVSFYPGNRSDGFAVRCIKD